METLMKRYRWGAGVILALAMAGCAGTGPEGAAGARPDWVAGESARYKPAQYITGRGEGRTMEQAQNQARADLAKFFSVAVRETGTDVQLFSRNSDKHGVEQQQQQQSVTRRLETYTDQVIQGVELVDRWQDPVTSQYYALAVAPRAQTIVRLQDEIKRLDDDTRRYIQQAQVAATPLAKVAQATRALEVQQQRTAVQRSLQAIDPTGQGVPPLWNLVGLKADRDAQLARIRVRLQAESTLTSFPPVLASALARVGMRAEDGNDIDYTLKAVLKLDPAMYQEGWYWQRGTLTVTLSLPNGTDVGVRQWPVKVSAQQTEILTARLIEQSGKLLDDELGTTLMGFATH